MDAVEESWQTNEIWHGIGQEYPRGNIGNNSSRPARKPGIPELACVIIHLGVGRVFYISPPHTTPAQQHSVSCVFVFLFFARRVRE